MKTTIGPLPPLRPGARRRASAVAALAIALMCGSLGAAQRGEHHRGKDFTGKKFKDSEHITYERCEMSGSSFTGAAKHLVFGFSNAPDSTCRARWSATRFFNSVFDRADFSKARLTDVQFTRLPEPPDAAPRSMSLIGAAFDEAELIRTTFRNVVLTDAQFCDARLSEGTAFFGSSLKRADFSGARFNRVLFRGLLLPPDSRKPGRADLKSTLFEDAELNGVEFIQCDLRGASFTDATARGYRLEDGRPAGQGQWVNGLRLGHCIAVGVLFDQVDAVKSNVHDTDLSSASFADAVLSETFFRNSTFVKTSFAGCELAASRWETVVDMSQADFEKANLERSVWRGIRSARGTTFREANLRHADFGNTNQGILGPFESKDNDLTQAIFAGADLRHAKLSPTELDGADLSNAQLDGADLSGARMSGTVLTGALFDASTSLPFDDIEAARRGMVKR